MTNKFLAQWGLGPEPDTTRRLVQIELDGGRPVGREGCVVKAGGWPFVLNTPGEAVKFAAALNRLRRPLHLVKKDLDEDWARRVKERDSDTCAICGVMGPKAKADNGAKRDALTAHHWLKTKARAGMARWARACGATVHYAEHIHSLHENPCWADLELICRHVAALEGEQSVRAALELSKVSPDEKLVRALWLERCGNAEKKGG